MNLWLDDVRSPLIGYEWVKTVEEAKKLLLTGEVKHASLDHDLGLCEYCLNNPDVREVRANLIRNPNCASFCSCEHIGTGYQLCVWMAETGNWPKYKPVVHSVNPVGADRMRGVIERYFEERL